MIMTRVIFLLVFTVLLGYAAMRLRRRRNSAEANVRGSGFRPNIGFTRLDGMESLSLLLDNRSREFVWAEEIEIFLSGLRAEQQTAEPSFHEVQKIRQTVRGGDMLPISLAQVIYKAAGDPQRKYSCVLSSLLHFRIGEEWFEKNLENYKIQMIGLKASKIQRQRKPLAVSSPHNKSQDVPAGSS